MTRPTWVPLAAMVTLIAATLVAVVPVRASHPRDVAPPAIDPRTLALPLSALPGNASVCLSGTLDGSGALSAGQVSADLGTAGALACGPVTAFVPSTGTTAGAITVSGHPYPIAAGITLTGSDRVDSLDHSAVSDNDDANGQTTPADGYKSQLRIIHQTSYDQLGRITGYRMDFHYFLSGYLTGTEYLVSIYPDAGKARAAMDDAVRPPALITIIGSPLAHQCAVGDACAAYSGPNPGTTNDAVLAIFRHGPIVVETATQVPAAAFSMLEPTLETTLYGLLGTADQLIQQALNPTRATATPTATIVPTATVTPTATETSMPPTPIRKACPKHSSRKHGSCVCKKGYGKKHRKCLKKKGHRL